AVLESRGLRVHGLFAWFAWAAVHLQFLAQSNLRVSVFLQWVWTYFSRRLGSALIIQPRSADRAKTPDLADMAKYPLTRLRAIESAGTHDHRARRRLSAWLRKDFEVVWGPHA